MLHIFYLVMLFGNRYEPEGPVGGALVIGEEVVLALYKDHRVLLLNRNLTVVRAFGTFGEGPRALNVPARVFLSPEGRIYVYNLGNRSFTVLDERLEFVRRFFVAPGMGIPMTRSALDARLFCFLSGYEEIFGLYRAQGEDGFKLLRKGGSLGRKNRQLGGFFQYHLLIPFASGRVLWADSIEKVIHLDETYVLRIDSTGFDPPLPKDPQAFKRVLGELDVFHPAGCFSFVEEGREMAIVTITNSRHAHKPYRVFRIDGEGEVLRARRRADFPLAFGQDGFLLSDGETIFRAPSRRPMLGRNR